ncbi:hypothetical protein SSX86_023268 [Deinandra increscens subsp. villosa]|uniref:non-specific serine/threonine protein kinase n=1 Tax=Deinandra increscens subsp. villosa TaxID=3103831 RepID=A0AAP0GR22_9ASTR
MDEDDRVCITVYLDGDEVRVEESEEKKEDGKFPIGEKLRSSHEITSYEEFSRFKFKLRRIVDATSNFSEENLIGQGAFGKIYRGNLLLYGERIIIAVRRLHYDYGQGDLEFWNEISMLASLKHGNLVSFIGFCDEKGEKIIINKHEVNGSLDKYLSSPTLTWMQRLQICVDVAHALNYIHCGDGRESSVIHRNIKSSKILLDENWKPKLSGFQHSKTNTRARRHRLVLTDTIGTIGYVDPTYEKTGFVTHKSDVYSFGVVLFEVLCGRRAFVPHKRQPHSPRQYFTEQYHKEGKLEKSLRSPRSPNSGSSSSFNYNRPSSFVGRRPLSFGADRKLHPGLFMAGASQQSLRPSFGADKRPRRYHHLFSVLLKVISCGGKRAFVLDDKEAQSHQDMEERLPTSLRTKSLPGDEPVPAHAPIPPAAAADDSLVPRNSYSSKERRFILEPVFTMKRLDQYVHTTNEELLADLANSHYDDETLDDIIDPALRKQMHPKSFKIFSETAYNCLKEKRVQRPNIDQILRNLEKALELQMRHEKHSKEDYGGEDKERTTNQLTKEGQLEHLKIPFIKIKKATNNFTDEPIGSGAYGCVYRSKLEVSIEEKGGFSRKWRTVAIKRIRQDREGKEGFNAEIELLSSCKHPNIVSLLGFCDEDRNPILVYEYACNKSLDDYLGNNDNSTNLTWVQRINIGIDIGNGLDYIHSRVDDEEKIVHRDIKSANILLSKNWVAKIADFGLSRFHGADSKEKTVRTNNFAGTKYYACPEYARSGRLKTAVDIYSFGVVLFELLFGKLAYDQAYIIEGKSGIADVARQQRTLHEMVDPKIMEEVYELTSTLHKGPNQDSLRTYFEIAHRCIAINQDRRPTAKEIVEELKKALSLQEKNKDNLQMSFKDIESATQDFDPKNIIGRGGFGKVYRGEVTRGNGSTTIVAKRSDGRQGQGEEHFLTELEILFEYKHENIIGLEGYCNENNEKIIIYEYACNKSLDGHLNNINLTWMKRLKICIDIARGLAFLHEGAPTKEMVIHRDIKSANILLNGDWKAKISDFGLSEITAINQEALSMLVGTLGYVDPQYRLTGFFTEKSDIYSLGVVLFEILYGTLLVPDEMIYDQENVTRILTKIYEREEDESIVFKDIKEQIAHESLCTFRAIVGECLYEDRRKRPTAEHVLQQLEKSLEFQEDYEIWSPKLPKDYEKILKLSKYSGNYSTKMKKDLYDKFLKGIMLQDNKVWFSLGPNGERNEMVSARTFSYRNHSPHDMWCIIPESRWFDQKVAKMLDISNLMIKIKTKTEFLSPYTVYGVHLVFKFCDSKNISRNPMYIDLKYRKGNKTLHAYFAQWRDDKWMMIELYRFSNQQEEVVLEFLLESLSHCRDDEIYVEGIEFRVIHNVVHDEAEKSKEIQKVTKSNLKVDQELQLPKESEMIFKRPENYEDGEKLFLLSEVNGKKHLMLSAKVALHNFPKSKLFNSKPSDDSSFQEVLELLPQPMIRISCTIESHMLSRDIEYVCYLVFKLSEKCHMLRCPVEVRDLLQKNKTAEIIYFRPPKPWNIHDITRVPKQRKDGWMEVNVWKFNSTHELKYDYIPVNLKLVSYEGRMSGLFVCGLEFRPM